MSDNKDSKDNKTEVSFDEALKEKFGDLPDDFVKDLVDDAERGQMTVDGLLTYAEKPVVKLKEVQVNEKKKVERTKELKTLLGDDYADKINQYRSKFKEDDLNPDDISPRALNSLIKSFEKEKQSTKSEWKAPTTSTAFTSGHKSSFNVQTKSFDDMKKESIEYIKKNCIGKDGRFNEGADREFARMIDSIMKRAGAN